MTLFRSPGYNPESTHWKGLLNPHDIAHAVVEIASEKQAENIVMLDIRGVASFADYFVILSAGTARQVSALREDLEKGLKESGASLHHREGTPDSGWVLLDFSDVIVHIFGTEQRDFYQLDQLWSRAAQVVTIL